MPVSFKEKSDRLGLQLQRSEETYGPSLCFFLRLLLLSAREGERDVLKLKLSGRPNSRQLGKLLGSQDSA